MKTIKNFIISSLTDDNGTLNKDIISIIFRPVIASLFFIMIAITFIQVIFCLKIFVLRSNILFIYLVGYIFR